MIIGWWSGIGLTVDYKVVVWYWTNWYGIGLTVDYTRWWSGIGLTVDYGLVLVDYLVLD